jgi:hypothetical protein
MKVLFTLAILAAAQFATAQKTVKLKEFTSISVSGDIKLALIKSSENKAVIEKDDEEIKIQDGGNSLAISGDGTLVVYYTATIENISAGTDTVVTSKDEIKGKSFNLSAAADSKILLNLNVKNLNVAAAADSQVKIDGKAELLVAAIASDAQFNVKELSAEDVQIVLASDAQALITAKGTVDATVASDGQLTIYGNPKKVNEVKSGDAEINIVR